MTTQYRTQDSFNNFEARLGLSADNLSSANGYEYNFITRNRQLLEAMYRGSWIVGQAVDTVADDMTCKGINPTGGIEPSAWQKIEQELGRLNIWTALADCIRWGCLYGGSIGVLLIDGQRMDTPLNLERVGKGQFKGLYVLDRWRVQVDMQNTVTELGPDLGQIQWYEVLPDASALRGQKIHYTRVVRFDGDALPYWQRQAENFWGISVVERLYDRLTAFDSATTGVSQLLYKSHLRTYKVDNLRGLIAGGEEALEGLLAQMNMIRRFQSNEGMTLLDAADTFEVHSSSFAGIAENIQMFAEQLSGSLQIPVVRLFGQSPSGFNGGEADLQTYYDGIHRRQNAELRDPVDKILRLIYRSLFGKAWRDDAAFDFAVLQERPRAEKADIGSKLTQAVIAAHEAGLIGTRTALMELKQSADLTDMWSNITDDDIAAADDEPPAPSPSAEDTDSPKF